MEKVSQAQKKANRKWRKGNPEQARKISYRSTARTFIRNWADEEDLIELETLINERRKQIKEGE